LSTPDSSSNDADGLAVDVNSTAPVGLAPPAEADGRRFSGVARAYGEVAFARFAAARVAIVGVGGVGSWIVEALARSAVGHLTLIDLDHVSESNVNRQIQATSATLGQAKVVALAERVALINPDCEVACVEEFIDPDNVASLLPPGRFDLVIDAVDDGRAKVAMAVHCHAHGIRLVVVGSAGGQTDAARVRVGDLAHTEHDPLLARVRKRLRSEHGFPRNPKAKFNIEAIYSDEPIVSPTLLAGQAPAGLNCAGYGSSVAVTAVFGLIAAGRALTLLARG
jgi:tRNA threonylcarbamoyladenosine dehydratase